MLIPSGEEGDQDWLTMLDRTSVGENQAQIFAEVGKLYKALMVGLRDVSDLVRARNQQKRRDGKPVREHPFSQMDPLALERSVSL